ncbi:aminodeoxychorismate synthase component I [Chelatococcus sp. GCM10030263]|uniref:aminodeoxychorismate synthase component I n=1 Tax=Chelatococcus sp. GCM10030263 TaxID=3273387 RepID=UPI00361C6DDD
MNIREIAGMDAVTAAERLRRLPGLTFLDSAMRHPALGGYSYVAADPFGSFVVTDGGARWNGGEIAGEPLALLGGLIARYGQEHRPDLPPFQGGAAGFVAYDFNRLIEKLPPVAEPWARPLPQACLNFYDVVLAFDHVEDRAVLISTGWPEENAAARAQRAAARAEAFLDHLAQPDRIEDRGGLPSILPERWQSNFTRPAYEAAVQQVIDYILAGDIFQANIAQRFAAELPAGFDAWRFYKHLRRVNAATFAAFLDGGDFTIASSSPERFLKVAGDRVETRPIKGTVRRSPDPAEDETRKAELLASEKDRAENLMIVDLLRNDLSRTCRPHTVETPVLCGIESYASVHHLVSVVTGQLEAGRTAVDLLRGAFPGGSITGAPKVRAMEIISAIEREARGVYCGSIGFLGFNGQADVNIAIRTVLMKEGRAVFQAGGGITALSDPEAEYEETLAKASRIFEAFAGAGAS